MQKLILIIVLASTSLWATEKMAHLKGLDGLASLKKVHYQLDNTQAKGDCLPGGQFKVVLEKSHTFVFLDNELIMDGLGKTPYSISDKGSQCKYTTTTTSEKGSITAIKTSQCGKERPLKSKKTLKVESRKVIIDIFQMSPSGWQQSHHCEYLN